MTHAGKFKSGLVEQNAIYTRVKSCSGSTRISVAFSKSLLKFTYRPTFFIPLIVESENIIILFHSYRCICVRSSKSILYLGKIPRLNKYVYFKSPFASLWTNNSCTFE